jgi:FMN phosphatase YigB (HAD superfamily)
MIYIFDLDGTLADIKHRLKHIQGDVKDWDAFYNACEQDMPIYANIETYRQLYRSGADVWIWSGRSELVREKTVNWLSTKGINPRDNLRMRPLGNHSPDYKLKRDWAVNLSAHDIGRIIGVFEDRDRVVSMWRGLGIQCYQVSSGNY